MPGFVTHYLFGEEIYHQLKCNSQKKNLFYNRSAYAVSYTHLKLDERLGW